MNDVFAGSVTDVFSLFLFSFLKILYWCAVAKPNDRGRKLSAGEAENDKRDSSSSSGEWPNIHLKHPEILYVKKVNKEHPKSVVYYFWNRF